MTSTVRVEVGTDPVDIPLAHDRAQQPWATLVLAHGAGAGMDHPFLTGFCDRLRGHGVSTVRFDFPYRVLGRKLPGTDAAALQTWRAVTSALAVEGPLIIAGKSYGGRMASMAVAEGMDADALVYLGYPLHSPGKPEKPKSAHLPKIRQPQLFVAGRKDPFTIPHKQLRDVAAGCADARIHWVPAAGHSFDVAGRKRAAHEVGGSLAPAVVKFLRDVTGISA